MTRATITSLRQSLALPLYAAALLLDYVGAAVGRLGAWIAATTGHDAARRRVAVVDLDRENEKRPQRHNQESGEHDPGDKETLVVHGEPPHHHHGSKLIRRT